MHGDVRFSRRWLVFPKMVAYVIAWVAVKFGINTTSVVLEMGKISRGKAE